jgi:hypothetical protein
MDMHVPHVRHVVNRRKRYVHHEANTCGTCV